MTDCTTDRPSSKVARLIKEYELEGLGEELEARWTADGVERMSLRDLAAFFNKRLLEQSLLDGGLSAFESEIETTYEHLTSDDVSPGVRTDTRTRLNQNGIDVEALESDFVTYQAIRSYLTEWRGTEYEGLSDAEKLAKDQESIQRLLTRVRSVIEERVERHQDTGRLDLAEYEVLLDIQVLCQECGSQHSVVDLLDHGGCDCVATEQ